MQTAAIIVWIYGALVLAGGIIGFVKAGSQSSLMSGSIFGVALLLAGLGIFREKSIDGAFLWAIVLTGLLALIMGVRFAKTRKFMPAGMICALSVVVSAILLYMLK